LQCHNANIKQCYGKYPFPPSGALKLATNQTAIHKHMHVVTTEKVPANIADKMYVKPFLWKYIIQLSKRKIQFSFNWKFTLKNLSPDYAQR
jgi:hypothetical protein